MSDTITDDRQLIRELRDIGVKAKRWINSGPYAPPADVNYKGELRVHTGSKPELVATDNKFKQAVIRCTDGPYNGEDFLIGMDETANFVCRLPVSVASVDQAHEILRPTGVMPHTTRQGEWFFVPVEKPCPCGKMPGEHTRGIDPHMRLGGTTHKVETGLIHMGVTFAKGKVLDDRKGRHAPVDLGDTWHQVFPNTERQLHQAPAKVRRFD
jgi:hypothetical protein